MNLISILLLFRTFMHASMPLVALNSPFIAPKSTPVAPEPSSLNSRTTPLLRKNSHNRKTRKLSRAKLNDALDLVQAYQKAEQQQIKLPQEEVDPNCPEAANFIQHAKNYGDVTCPHCTTAVEYQENGFSVCPNAECGRIFENALDNSPEWRFYGADDAQSGDPSRCGPVIDPLMKDAAFGCRINNVKKCGRDITRAAKHTEWLIPYDQKVLYANFQNITKMCQIANIPDIIVNTARVYYKKIVDHEKSYRGNNKDGLIAASIYIACRIHGCPRSAKEIAEIFHISQGTATNGCKIAQSIISEMETAALTDDNATTIFCALQPQNFIERYCSHVSFPDELTSLCSFIAVKIDAIQCMSENTPMSIAVGIIHFVSIVFGLGTTKHQIANVSGISEMTINKCSQKLMTMRDKLIPSMLLNKYNVGE